MAHEISLKANMNFVLHKDVEFLAKNVSKTGTSSKLGTLMVSKGNIEWMPKGNSKTRYAMTWAKLGELMVEKGRKVTKRKAAKK